MASGDQGRAGSEYGLRDDDRATPYSGTGRRATSGYGLVLVLGLLAAGAIFGYGLFHPGEGSNQARPEATAGTAR